MMNAFQAGFIKLFERDLGTLSKEISLYPSESVLWIIRGEIKNSGGNLALHLCGNLRHFIGHVLGNSRYIRNREAEFSDRDVARKAILDEIDRTVNEVRKTLSSLTEDDLGKIYPIKVLGYEMKTSYFIAHLYGHLNYHLGQINYHRRLVSA